MGWRLRIPWALAGAAAAILALVVSGRVSTQAGPLADPGPSTSRAVMADPGPPVPTNGSSPLVSPAQLGVQAGDRVLHFRPPAAPQSPAPIGPASVSTVTVLAETFDGISWPDFNPSWAVFDSDRSQQLRCRPNGAVVGRDCDLRWGAGIAVTTQPTSSLYGLKFAWPAAGGGDGFSPFEDYVPANIRTWMIFGPFNLADAQEALMAFTLLGDPIRVAPGGVFASGLFWGVSSDGENYTGYACCDMTRGDAPVYLRFTDSMLRYSNGSALLTATNQVFFGIEYINSAADASGNPLMTTSFIGAFIDDLVLNKQVNVDPRFSHVYVPSAPASAAAAPSGAGSSGQGIANGGFENGFAGWRPDFGNMKASVSANAKHSPTGGSFGALLGDPGLKCSSFPLPPANGKAIIRQGVTIPATSNPRLRFWYRIFTEDKMYATTKDPLTLDGDPKFGDSLDVVVIDSGNARTIFRDGRILADILDDDHCDNTANRASMVDLGWKQADVPLKRTDSVQYDFTGRSVTLSFELVNRPDNVYNSYVHIDEVELVP